MTKSVWTCKSVTSNTDNSRFRPEVVRFIQRGLFFSFKALEECVGSMGFNQEQMVLSFDKLVKFGWSNDFQTKSMIVEAFGKLVASLDRFGFTMDADDWSIIANLYITTANSLLESNI